MSPEKVDPLFGDEHTHITRAGAELNAQCVIAGLKAIGSVGRDRSRSSFPTPDLAVSNSSCGLWSCDHHGGSDCNVHTDGLDLAFSVLPWHYRGLNRVWPLQAAAGSGAPLMRAVPHAL